MTTPTYSISYARRVPFWDNLRGLLIVLVVLGHFLWGYRENEAFLLRECAYFIYLFHMPAFIFISGYFSRNEDSISLESITKLLVAFLLLNFGMMFYGVMVEHEHLSLIYLYYSSWYLWALVLYRATLPLLYRIPNIVPISVAASLLIGFCKELSDVLEFPKIIAFYPFFIIGAKCSTSGMESLIDILKKKNG